MNLLYSEKKIYFTYQFLLSLENCCLDRLNFKAEHRSAAFRFEVQLIQIVDFLSLLFFLFKQLKLASDLTSISPYHLHILFLSPLFPHLVTSGKHSKIHILLAPALSKLLQRGWLWGQPISSYIMDSGQLLHMACFKVF